MLQESPEVLHAAAVVCLWPSQPGAEDKKGSGSGRVRYVHLRAGCGEIRLPPEAETGYWQELLFESERDGPGSVLWRPGWDSSVVLRPLPFPCWRKEAAIPSRSQGAGWELDRQWT